ncbi:MAG: sigma factor-like helix-turn-helix DNA-binding protein [Acutalibacteraceae bacterium]|nr:sigma factor-like helix-turn-helix DNA-binding protein [Acutalibacteraceae bacterium]
MGYSVAEIAELTKTNPSTVKTRLSRAREKLKKTLKEEKL